MMKILSLSLTILISLFACKSTYDNAKDKSIAIKLLYVNGEHREYIDLKNNTENTIGKRTIYLIDAECPKCLFSFLLSLDTTLIPLTDILVFSVYQNSDYFCNLIQEKANMKIPFYIDSSNIFYNYILENETSENGIVNLSEDIIVVINPDRYK